MKSPPSSLIHRVLWQKQAFFFAAFLRNLYPFELIHHLIQGPFEIMSIAFKDAGHHLDFPTLTLFFVGQTIYFWADFPRNQFSRLVLLWYQSSDPILHRRLNFLGQSYHFLIQSRQNLLQVSMDQHPFAIISFCLSTQLSRFLLRLSLHLNARLGRLSSHLNPDQFLSSYFMARYLQLLDYLKYFDVHCVFQSLKGLAQQFDPHRH